MAAILALPTNSSNPLISALDPPPSQDFAMHNPSVPDVFVIPPEEEHEDNPPWCYFDAAAAAKQSLCTSPDMDALDVALGLCQQRDNRAPSFHRHHSNASQETIVMPRRGALPRLHDADLDMEDGQTDIRSRSSGSSSTLRNHHRTFDEEIVEVVKVRRNEGMADVGDGRTLKMKKSSTFRARATQALRSIKNVGKSNTSNRRASVSAPKLMMPAVPAKAAKTEQAFGQPAATLPSRHSYQEPSDLRPTSPTVNRRRSLTLSQMFAFKEKEKENQGGSRPPSPMSAEPPSPAVPPHEPESSARPMSPTEFRSSSSHGDLLQPIEDYLTTPTSPASPSDDPSKPTLSKRKSFRRRLSVLELQKLFSIGSGSSSNSQSHPNPPQDAEDDLVSLASRSRPLSMDSTAILSSASSLKSSLSLTASEMSGRPSASSRRSGGVGPLKEPIEVLTEEDLEMRLDSLHFDSLHFDPDEIMGGL